MPEKTPPKDSDANRFKKNLAALMVVPKAEIEELEANRPKRRPRKSAPKSA